MDKRLSDWTEAENIEELKGLFPPLPPPLIPKSLAKPKRNGFITALNFLLIVAFTVITLFIVRTMYVNNKLTTLNKELENAYLQSKIALNDIDKINKFKIGRTFEEKEVQYNEALKIYIYWENKFNRVLSEGRKYDKYFGDKYINQFNLVENFSKN